jgi:hypothetical protein
MKLTKVLYSPERSEAELQAFLDNKFGRQMEASKLVDVIISHPHGGQIWAELGHLRRLHRDKGNVAQV